MDAKGKPESVMLAEMALARRNCKDGEMAKLAEANCLSETTGSE